MTLQATGAPPCARRPDVLVDHGELLAAVTAAFTAHGLPDRRAHAAAAALCHGDLVGFGSHGVFNLSRLYLPLLRSGRADATAEPRVITDLGACVLLDARRALGLWSASEAMDLAVERARRHGVGLVSVRNGTHFGCAGHHTARAAEQGLIGVLASNCGGQRIARPPHAQLAMLGTNPLSVAAPALDGHPFVLDMSTTVVPTGRIRAAARGGSSIPPGWLEDAEGAPVTDPGAFDRGEAYLRWLGGTDENGAYKGYGLGLAVEVLAALLPGAQLGPAADVLEGDGRPHGRDDDIGFLVLAIAPEALRPPGEDFRGDARDLFTTLTQCPPTEGHGPVRYPGWWEAERALTRTRDGVPLPAHLHDELTELGLLPAALPAALPTAEDVR
ncbi:Ldh family oxidoreductase [Streptomyces sp. V3I7]|uniref:Ldh family oxidoreductase n=1 Tax=Streptomyces sp. V3I7 TaxID=3042278 RepID=UPI002782D525|nr:Ldh family oxidoreductase [Streptomyces sp. V3I7]MDQ0994389.1 LDH2 family malate/lactate/ureidoglycolate dehydrogenase [Streptomyces sp. V3I7]